MINLSTRLALALLAIVLLMGIASYVLLRANSTTYHDELTQRLNAPIAMYVTEQLDLIEDGSPKLENLQNLATHAMMINPSAEIYLLDEKGNILGHNMDESAVTATQVDLQPLRQFMQDEPRFPIYAEDPRNTGHDKVFSVWPIKSGGQQQGSIEGYVYVVLGGQTYETLVSNISDTYAFRSGLVASIAIVIFAGIAGGILFLALTIRLNKLHSAMKAATTSNFTMQPNLPKASRFGDEIDQLSALFGDMSAKISLQLDQLAENDRLRRELISNISHDLRTPLSAMQGFFETLVLKKDELTADERDRFIASAHKHVIRMGELVGDLFELSKLDATSRPANLEPFSMSELVQDIAQDFELIAKQKNIALVVDTEPVHPQTLGDIGLIHRALENLVKNALQAVSEGGQVTIQIRHIGDTINVAVADNGPGIPETVIPRLFDRFFRVRNGEEAQAESSGLGLAIVKRIMDLHGAKILVTSRPNAGARFAFDLPIAVSG